MKIEKPTCPKVSSANRASHHALRASYADMDVHDQKLTDPDILSKISSGYSGTSQWPDQEGLIMQAITVMREEHEDATFIITAACRHAAPVQLVAARPDTGTTKARHLQQTSSAREDTGMRLGQIPLAPHTWTALPLKRAGHGRA